METGEFHWQDGWYFKRMPDGITRARSSRRLRAGRDHRREGGDVSLTCDMLLVTVPLGTLARAQGGER